MPEHASPPGPAAPPDRSAPPGLAAPQDRPPWTIGPRRLAILPLEALIWLYRITLSPIIGRQCRYEPTCSRFGLEALQVHGPFRGSWLTARRILRCHPFATGGYDPVPPAHARPTPTGRTFPTDQSSTRPTPRAHR